MASKNKKDDWLPPGWKVRIKSTDAGKLKCYVHLETRQKFYSKPAVLRFINDGSVSNDNSHTSNELDKKSPVEQQMQLVEANPSADWLPTGWTMELKPRLSGAKKGTMYKVFCDPSSGSKFYSKPEVLRYLKSGAGSSGQKERSSSRQSTRNGNRSVDRLEAQKTSPVSSDWQISVTGYCKTASGREEILVDKTADEDLQSGWIKETRKKMHGNPAVRTDPSSDDRLEAQKTDSESSYRLEAQNTNSESSDWQISEKRNRESVSSRQKKVIVERTVDKDLPSGWIKEMRKKMRENGVVRTDPFFLDPASDLVFRSKLEVLRYLETGVISRHAYRRRNGSSNREELCIEKTSPISVARKTTTKCRTGKQLFAGEEVPYESASLVPESKSIKESGVRSNRSSLRVRSAAVGETGLKQSASLLESNKITQEMLPTKRMIKKCSAPNEAVSMTDILPKIQDADEVGKTTIPMEIESPTSSSRTIVTVGNATSVAMQGRSGRKAPTKSFKESGVRRSTRSSLRVRSAAAVEASLKQSAFLLEPDKITQEILPSIQIIKKCSVPDEAVSMTDISCKIQDADEEEKNTIPQKTELPVSSSRAIVTVENPVSVATQECSIGKSQTSKRKREDRKLPSVPSRSSKRLAGVDAQVVFHRIPIEHALRASNRKSMGTNSVSSLVSLDNDLQDKPELPNAETSNVLTSQEAKPHTFDIGTQSVFATQEKPGNNSDNLVQDDPDVVDLQEQPPGFSGNLTDEMLSKSTAQSSKDPRVTVPDSLMQDDPQVVDLLDQTPPGFSGYSIDEVSKSMVQSSEDPKHSVIVSEMNDIPSDDPTAQGHSNALLGSKVEKPAADFPVTGEQLGSITKEAEPSATDFGFPAPLWSDPCLEFAYKTLTGAIPLDDSLAIEDYIQHQLRTSHSNEIQSLPNIGVPSFFQNDETKVVHPLPKGVTVPDSNGFGSQKTNR